jgi:uncharacterized protein
MVHAYKNGGYNIVLDVNSGSVHVVDDVVYDLVPVVEKMLVSYHGTAAATDTDKEGNEDFQKLFNEVSGMSDISSKYSSEDIGEAISEILELRASEVLYTDDVYENYVDDFQNRDTVVKALCLNIAHDCNLRCKYCFADEGEYHGRRALMTEEVGKKALDFLVANSGNRRNLEVDFFGGEPLMNWEVVKKIVEYGRSIEKEKTRTLDLPSPPMELFLMMRSLNM